MVPIIFAQDEFTENSLRLKSVKVNFSPTALAQAVVPLARRIANNHQK